MTADLIDKIAFFSEFKTLCEKYRVKMYSEQPKTGVVIDLGGKHAGVYTFISKDTMEKTEIDCRVELNMKNHGTE